MTESTIASGILARYTNTGVCDDEQSVCTRATAGGIPQRSQSHVAFTYSPTVLVRAAAFHWPHSSNQQRRDHYLIMFEQQVPYLFLIMILSVA